LGLQHVFGTGVAVTNHVAKENHVIDWSGVRVPDTESHRRTRQLNESIRIRKEANCMNKDGGAYNLPGYQRPMTVFWSRAHRQRHVTIYIG